MTTLFKNIGLLAGISEAPRKEGAEMGEVECLRNAWLLVDGETIADFGGSSGSAPCGGSFSSAPASSAAKRPICTAPAPTPIDADLVIDADGAMLLPAFCDSHSHIVYAGSRELEFEDKIRGLSYAEIAQRGGGILHSADRTHSATEDELFAQSLERVKEMMLKGSGAIEIKSGYGLNTQDELKMLRVIRRLSSAVPATIKATFLGAHAVPHGLSKDEYVRKVCSEMVPAVAGEQLAEYVDVFCEQGFFSPEDTNQILAAGRSYGLKVKLHANQLAVSGGVQVGVKNEALSVDHLERTTSAEINCLKGTATMPTMLPGASFFLREPYGNAKGFIENGLGVALASDYNPGSSPSGDMRFIMALGCIHMRLTPTQAFNAVTLNGAYAMGVNHSLGSIAKGKIANLILCKKGFDTLGSLAYQYQTPFINKVFIRGKEV